MNDYPICWSDCPALRLRGSLEFGCARYCVRLKTTTYNEPLRVDDCRDGLDGFKEVP